MAHLLTDTIKTPEATNISTAITSNLQQYAIPTNIQTAVTGIKQIGTQVSNFVSSLTGGRSTGVPNGAQPVRQMPAYANFNSTTPDFRPRLVIPSLYIQSSLTTGPNNVILNSGGIVFPYTPSIAQDYKAAYASASPQHSNYGMYFYKNSTPGEISLNAKFTVQDYNDAHYYLSVIHILRSLIKMRFGTNDVSTGAPPPVCRLHAYGTYMMDNVPVALQSFSIKYEDNVDYFSLSPTDSIAIPDIFNGVNTVPILTTISMTFIPMYSRREMMNGGVTNWLYGKSRNDGLL